MATQSFIWTALPNGYTEDRRFLRLSVMLSPRLHAQGDPPRLDTFFPEWQNWPKTIRSARFEVAYNGQPIVAVLGHQTTGANRLDDRLGLVHSPTWQALFHDDLFVRGYEFTDLSNHHVVSYDTMALHEKVRGLYRDLARQAGDDRPLLSQIADDPAWASLVEAVGDLDRAFADENTGLRNPALQFRNVLQGPFAPGASGDHAMFARFQLFHTPPATPRPAQPQRKDDPRVAARWLEYKRLTLPPKSELARQFDFHQVISAMGSYPTLQRRLGLVIDLLLDPRGFPQLPAAPLAVTVSFPPGSLRTPKTPDASPVTQTLLDRHRFQAVSNAAAEFQIVDGLLDLDPKRFGLLQMDVDGAGLKVMNFARSLGRRQDDESRVDSVTRHEENVGAPALRTAGLMLVQRDRWFVLKARFSDQQHSNFQIESLFKGGVHAPVLFAEDLVRGYRIDIWDSHSRAWHSLCRRQATYALNNGALLVEPEEEEECTVRLAATKSPDPASNPTALYLHEALVAWTGWSLAAPPPGRVIKSDDDTKQAESDAELPPGLDFKSTFKPVKGSLPRLRFGRKYWLRARAVDLAGNSLPHREKDFGPERPEDNQKAYLRYEPVAAPIVALLERGGIIEEPAEGESMSRIAIRSFNVTPADNLLTSPALAHRVIAPAAVSARDAEQHGKLDAAGKVDSTTFDLLANQKDIDPRKPGAAIREVKIPMQGPLEDEPVDTTFAVYQAGRSLTYLPDPLAEVVSVRVFDHPNMAPNEVIPISLYPSGHWPEAQPFEIEVYEDPVAKPLFDPVNHRLRVPLPKAVRAKLRFSCQLSSDALGKMGLFAWLSEADQATQRARAESGQHWMLTPWHIVEVVHAVQKPLISPEITNLHVQERGLGVTSARPVIHASCSINSTDRLDLRAEWHEPLDDSAQTASAAGPVDQTHRDLAFSVKIADEKSYALRLAGHKAGGYPDHLIPAPDVVGINLVAFDLIPPKAHEFHDCRYRRIEYWFDATSRFREFMPAEVLTQVAPGEMEVEANIRVTGPRAVTWIPCSAPPPAPKILYIVPTFGWTRSQDAQGRLTSWRRGGGLRIYLDRKWNLSGYGEMLAVVLPPASFAGEPETEPKEYPYKKYVTQWGNDPIWDSPFVAGIAPKRADFPLARIAPDPTGAWLPVGAPPSEADQKPGPFRIAGLIPAGVGTPGSVEIAPHDVFYDPDRRLWYCDIEIEAGASYCPFIRLALARYQPISSDGAHLSSVVLADIMSLTMDRWLNVTPLEDPRRRHLTVFGLSYHESSGYQEATLAPSMSLIDLLAGRVETLEPAKIARSSIVEVWVERLNPSNGEDFGWERVADAIVRSGDSSSVGTEPGFHGAVHSPFARPAAASTRLQAADLVAKRRFDAVARERMIDLVRALQTLWEGDVILPSVPSSSDRFRLVIAEYEEYLVDDSRPFDKVPTRSDRRLVFVEHVELTTLAPPAPQ